MKKAKNSVANIKQMLNFIKDLVNKILLKKRRKNDAGHTNTNFR